MTEEFDAYDLCEEDRSVRGEFVKLFYPKNNDDLNCFNPFLIAMEIEKMSPDSFYANLGSAIARSWYVMKPLINFDRMKVSELVRKAEELIRDDPRKKRWLKRGLVLIRKNFAKINVPYDY